MKLKTIFKICLCLGLVSLPLNSKVADAQSDAIDQILITVDGQPITDSEIARRINWLEFLARDSGQTNFSKEAARAQAIDDAIVFRLLVARANTIGVFVSPDELLERTNAIVESNNTTPEQFFGDLEAEGISTNDVQQSLTESILNEKLVQRVLLPRVQIREQEIDRYIANNQDSFQPEEQYDLSVIIVSESLSMTFEQKQFLRQVVGEIKYELERGVRFSDVAAAASRIDGIQAGDLGWARKADLDPNLAGELSSAAVNSVVGPVSSGGNTFFAMVRQRRTGAGLDLPELQELNLARIVLQASNAAGTEVNAEQLDNLRTTILDGGDFSEIARVYSHDSTTRKSGGDMGWATEDTIPFEYIQPLSEMEVGDISPVQQIENIVFILHYRGVRQAAQEERLRSFVRNRLRSAKLRSERANWIDELRESAVIDYRTTF